MPTDPSSAVRLTPTPTLPTSIVLRSPSFVPSPVASASTRRDHGSPSKFKSSPLDAPTAIQPLGSGSLPGRQATWHWPRPVGAEEEAADLAELPCEVVPGRAGLTVAHGRRAEVGAGYSVTADVHSQYENEIQELMDVISVE
uniref:Uncharacterized protein n=1 Tax=Zea mays TaxID=4577 RepID=A0A804P1W0_MAIZE